MLKQLLDLYDESRINPGPPECLFAETLVFNEGWLLRSVLKAWREQAQPAPLAFLPFPTGVHLCSEAQLYTPFRARFRGDKQAEGHARVDGIVGHLKNDDTKVGISLSPHCSYLSVFEAKLGSPLAKGTTNIPDYDQVSRLATCIIDAMLQAERVEDIAAHLVVLYPDGSPHINPSQHSKGRVETQIADRASGYLGSTTRTQGPTRFFRQWHKVLDRVQIDFVTWEEVVAQINDPDLGRFYDLCRQFNLT